MLVSTRAGAFATGTRVRCQLGVPELDLLPLQLRGTLAIDGTAIGACTPRQLADADLGAPAPSTWAPAHEPADERNLTLRERLAVLTPY